MWWSSLHHSSGRNRIVSARVPICPVESYDVCKTDTND
jgi:hypothetical protein